jgi:GNAT superfamily N-acetyltransferase
MPGLLSLASAAHERDGYPPSMPDDDLLSFLVSNIALAAWVAIDQGEVIGHVALHPAATTSVVDLAAGQLGRSHDEIGVVSRLLVASERRREGLGTCLVGLATSECRRLGLIPILDVGDGLDAAIALYEKLRWRRLGHVEVRLPTGIRVGEYVYTAPDEPGHT